MRKRMSQDDVALGNVIAAFWLTLGGFGLAWFRDVRHDTREWSRWALAAAIATGPLIIIATACYLGVRRWRQSRQSRVGERTGATKTAEPPR